jgi:hypothetical protein
MRREGYEFEIGPPKVITKEINGQKCEPYEEAIVEVPDTSIGEASNCSSYFLVVISYNLLYPLSCITSHTVDSWSLLIFIKIHVPLTRFCG